MFESLYISRIAELKPWLENTSNKNRLLERPLQRAEKVLSLESSKELEILQETMLLLRGPVTWYAKLGLNEVLNGDQNGWADVKKALYLYYCRINMWLYSYLKMPHGWQPAEPGSLDAAKALYARLFTDKDVLRSSTGDYLLESLSVENVHESDLRAPVVFSVYLYCRLNEIDVSKCRVVIDALGDYADVHKCWESDDVVALESAILRFLDYHLSIIDPFKYENDEFVSAPFNLVAIEYFALVAVRSRLGLSAPRPEHVFLAGPLGSPPSEVPKGEDTIFDEAIQRVQELFPDV